MPAFAGMTTFYSDLFFGNNSARDDSLEIGMQPNEFGIIEKYFHKKIMDKNVKCGVGDDCAILTVPKNKCLATSVDTLVAGVHFFADQDPESIGYKSLAVNLSDLAAMGAEPAWASMALTLPEINDTWLKKFSKGFFNLLNTYNMQLIGGNIAKGPLNISVQVFGFLPQKKAMLRSAAKVHDKIYVTNVLGDAAFAVAAIKKKFLLKAPDRSYFEKKLFYPLPRICIGLILLEVANAAIDLSDGLLQDLNHILDASEVGATVYTNAVPISKILQRCASNQEALRYALTGGDDYELCFTVSEKNEKKLFHIAKKYKLKFYCVGKVDKQRKLQVIDAIGNIKKFDKLGYEHFE
jgi:thiamine-monophosphate kinase